MNTSLGLQGKITDYFKVGDKVQWVRVRGAGSAIEIKLYSGKIEAIEGSQAVISSSDYKRRVKVSLFDLEVVK